MYSYTQPLQCKNGLVKLTNHWLPQFHLLFSLFIYRAARRSRTVLLSSDEASQINRVVCIESKKLVKLTNCFCCVKLANMHYTFVSKEEHKNTYELILTSV